MPVSKVAAAARAFVAVPPALARSCEVALKVDRDSSPRREQEAPAPGQDGLRRQGQGGPEVGQGPDVAKNVAGGLRKACKQVVDRKGAAADK